MILVTVFLNFRLLIGTETFVKGALAVQVMCGSIGALKKKRHNYYL